MFALKKTILVCALVATFPAISHAIIVNDVQGDFVGEMPDGDDRVFVFGDHSATITGTIIKVIENDKNVAIQTNSSAGLTSPIILIGNSDTQTLYIEDKNSNAITASVNSQITLLGSDISVLSSNIAIEASPNVNLVIGDTNSESVYISGNESALKITGNKLIDIEGRKISLLSNTSDALYFINSGILKIGDKTTTERLEVTTAADEGYAAIFMTNKDKSAGPSAELYAKNIVISSPHGNGVWLQNNTENEEMPTDSTNLKISADNIAITTPNCSALMAFSNSKLDIEGNLVINAKNVVDARGNATININTDGKYSTILNGDIVFETPNEKDGDTAQSGSLINAKLTISLNGESSSWTGRAYQSFPGNEDGVNLEGNDDYYGNVESFTLNISNGARWEMTGNSLANNVNISNGGSVTVYQRVTEANIETINLDAGILNLQGSSNQVVTVSSLAGNGYLNVNATTEDGRTLVTPKFNVTAVSGIAPTLNVTATGVTSDQIVDAEAAMLSFSSGLDLDGINTVQTITEGNVNGAITQVIDSQGNAQEISIAQNTKLDAFGSVAALNAVSWRHELNSVSKRMGELRDAPEGVGAWARFYGSEMEYGDQNVKAKNTTIQIGSDYKIGQWTVGATVGYTDGDSDYDRGSSDNEAWNFGVYGTWFADNGQYVDLIAKYSRLSQDFKLDTMTGDYDNNAFVVSAEYGWHLPVMELGFIEPQVELTYGRIMGEDFTTGNSVRIEQDDFDSFIGRLGVRAGIKCPDNWGTIYARASVVHDFDGEFNAKARSLTTSATADIFEDLGGTWGEFGIGANINFTKNTYMYVDAEITSGGEVDENYRWNIGVRHNF